MRKLLLLISIAGVAFAQPALVQCKTSASGSVAGSVPVTMTGTPTVGNVMVTHTFGNQTTGAMTFGAPTDNQASGGNIYTVLVSATTSTIVPTYGSSLACASITKASGSFIVTGNLSAGTTYLEVTACEFSGLTCTADGTDSLKLNNGGASPWLTYTTGITTTNANDVVFGAISAAISNPMNFTAAGSPGTFIIDANGKQDNES